MISMSGEVGVDLRCFLGEEVGFGFDGPAMLVREVSMIS